MRRLNDQPPSALRNAFTSTCVAHLALRTENHKLLALRVCSTLAIFTVKRAFTELARTPRNPLAATNATGFRGNSHETARFSRARPPAGEFTARISRLSRTPHDSLGPRVRVSKTDTNAAGGDAQLTVASCSATG